MKICLIVLSIFYLFLSCSQAKHNEDKEGVNFHSAENEINCTQELIRIDFDHQYSKIKMDLSDISYIEYIKLETTDSTLLKGVNNVSMSKDRIIFCDRSVGNIYIYDREGKCTKIISHKGEGPFEYSVISNFCVNHEKEEIYIYDNQLKYRIIVYSFSGKFLRELKLSEKIWIDILYNYDDDNLICHDSNGGTKNIYEHPYYIVNKKTGNVTPLPIKIKERISNGVMDQEGHVFRHSLINIYPMINTNTGVIISDFGIDSIFNYSNKKMSAIAVRKNYLIDKQSSYLSTISAVSNRYIFFNTVKKQIDVKGDIVLPLQSINYLYDKKDRTIYESEISFSDIGNISDVTFNSYNMELPNNCIVKILPADVLLNRLNENRLSGDLISVASMLEEDSNPVLMVAKFKE